MSVGGIILISSQRVLGQKVNDFLIDLSLDTRDMDWFIYLVNKTLFLEFFHDFFVRKGKTDEFS